METGPLLKGVEQGEPRALARALTLLENDPDAGARLLADAGPRAARAHRVGLTGPPGVGKSTLVAALAAVWRQADRRVAILAVDPTSPFSGGALLGDRIRMGALAGDPNVYIRSLATRGASGGLSLAVDDAADLLDLAGFDPVVVETVGVGQAEVEIAKAADTTVLVLAPGGGDEIQAMKAGIAEAADLVVVNQADRRDADDFVRGLEDAFGMRAGPQPAILRTIATKGEGVEAVRAAIDARTRPDRAEALAAGRLARARRRVRAEVDRRRTRTFWAGRDAHLTASAEAVRDGRETVVGAARRLLEDGEEGGS